MFESFGYLWRAIELIAEYINFTVNVVIYMFSFGAFTGKFIVDTVVKVLMKVYKFSSSVIDGIIVMYEDFRFFLGDICNIFSFITSIFSCVYEFISHSILFVVQQCMEVVAVVMYTVVGIKDNVCYLYRTGVKTICDLILTFKGALILIGNAIWMSLTLIPGFFLYVIGIFGFFINRCIEEILTIFTTIWNTLICVCTEIYLSLSDTPLEAVCGLCVGFVIIYFLSKYKFTILYVTKKNCNALLKYVQTLCVESLVFILSVSFVSIIKCKIAFYCLKEVVYKFYRRIVTNLPVPNPVIVSKTGGDRSCIICKDNEVSVLIIPCKHLCLCEDCSKNSHWNRQNAACPICRNRVISFVKVYV